VIAYLVELYFAETDAAVRGAERTRLAAEELTREGTPVRCLSSIFVPEDETCFLLCESASVEAVREAVRRAALPFARVARAVAEPAVDGVEGGRE
jgi:predicted methyltransferase MtxX (methanogen marker protein 4)